MKSFFIPSHEQSLSRFSAYLINPTYCSPFERTLQPFLDGRRHTKKVADDLPDCLTVERCDFQLALFRLGLKIPVSESSGKRRFENRGRICRPYLPRRQSVIPHVRKALAFRHRLPGHVLTLGVDFVLGVHEQPVRLVVHVVA